ncbi:MAG: DMT family transporter [Clostridiaceae bacterium]|nr:DMT family transporter [Clostridiaceae bacterium]
MSLTRKKVWFADSILLLVALIWGMNYVAQSIGADYLPAPVFNFFRYTLGTIFIWPVSLYRHKRWERELNKFVSECRKRDLDPEVAIKAYEDADDHWRMRVPPQANWMEWRLAIPGGIIAGICVAIGGLLQQTALETADAGTAGVISGLYVVIVPFLGLFFKDRLHVGNIIGSIIALVGLFLVSFKSGGSFGSGELMLIASAIFFALHIIVISRVNPTCDSLKIAVLQNLVPAIISLLIIFFGHYQIIWEHLLTALPSLLYAGIASTGIAFTLQVIAQDQASPSHAAIIMSLEAVFAVIGGRIFLEERLSLRVYIGIVLMIAAMLISQIAAIRQATGQGKRD